MSKKLLILVALFLLVVINLILHYFYLQNKNGAVISNLKINGAPENIEGYPFIIWEDITSGKLLKFLQKSDSEGKFPPFSENTEPVSSFQTSTPSFFEITNITRIELSDRDVKSEKYLKAEKRPYIFVAFFKTKLNNVLYFVLVQKWINSDGSKAFLPLIVPESIVLKDGVATTYYEKIITSASAYFLSPIIKFKGQETCSASFPNSASYCDWYFKDANKYSGVIADWTRSNMVPEEAGKYPFIFTLTTLAR